MAQRAEIPEIETNPRGEMSVVPLRTVPETKSTLTKWHIATVYHDAQIRATRSWSFVAQNSKALMYHVEHIARQNRNEHPLRIVAAAAGAAFVGGVLLRIWRSRRYEP